MEVGVDAVEGQRFVPHQPVCAEYRLPVELDERRRAVGADEPERVHTEALHHPVRPRDRPVRHRPHQHVRRLGEQRDEVPEGGVRGLGLGDLAIGFRFGGVDQVGELDAVADEEHRDVVADQVEHAFVGIELDREPAHVAHGVGRTARTDHSREPCEHRRHPAGLQEVGARDLGRRAVRLEHSVGGRAAGVDHPLGDPLVVEVHDLLAQMEVLHQRRPARPRRERVVGLLDAHTLLGGQELAVLGGHFAATRHEYGPVGRLGSSPLCGALVGRARFGRSLGCHGSPI